MPSADQTAQRQTYLPLLAEQYRAHFLRCAIEQFLHCKHLIKLRSDQCNAAFGSAPVGTVGIESKRFSETRGDERRRNQYCGAIYESPTRGCSRACRSALCSHPCTRTTTLRR